jgi:RNA polymerase sigma factor (sigma-70 family)
MDDACLDLQQDVALRLWDGDQTVLTVILTSYAPAIEACLFKKYRRVLTREDIEDVVALAVMALWEYRASYDDKKGTVWTLLYCMADCKAKDVIALGWQKARQLEIGNGHELLAQRATTRPPSTDSPPPSNKLLVELNRVVAELPEDQQRILIAKSLAPDGEVTAGILGEELGMPEGTVRVYLSRAKQTVRREMARRGYTLP